MLLKSDKHEDLSHMADLFNKVIESSTCSEEQFHAVLFFSATFKTAAWGIYSQCNQHLLDSIG